MIARYSLVVIFFSLRFKDMSSGGSGRFLMLHERRCVSVAGKDATFDYFSVVTKVERSHRKSVLITTKSLSAFQPQPQNIPAMPPRSC